MRNETEWRPSKYVMRDGRLHASSDVRMVAPGSWLITDLVAERYSAAAHHLRAGRVLDLGCGAVPLYEFYRSRVESVVCIDWPGTLHGQKHLDCYADLNLGVPICEASCDTVILSDVLEHVYAHGRLVGEIARVLRPDGALMMNVPFLYRIHEEPNDHFRYTEFALRRMLGDAGLEVLSIQPIGGLLEVIADLVAKTLARVPLAGRLLAMALQRSVRWLGKIPWVGGAMARSGRVFPLGYMVIARRRTQQS